MHLAALGHQVHPRTPRDLRITSWQRLRLYLPSERGSHIPDDRNGIKFYRPKSELLKRDEPGMKEQVVELPPDFDAKGATLPSAQRVEPSVLSEIERRYVQRYFSAFGAGVLS